VNIPGLGAGKSFAFSYTLAAPCAGHQVRAAVTLASDPAPANNEVLAVACGPIPDPNAPAGVNAADPRLSANQPGVVDCTAHPLLCASNGHPAGVAVNQPGFDPCASNPTGCPGVHSLDLPAGAMYSAVEERDSCGNTPLGSAVNQVGWIQNGDCRVEVGQLAVDFDLGALDQIPTKLVSEASLTFDEQERVSADGTASYWRDTDGSHRNVDGCVSVVGVATEDWLAAGPGKGSVQNDTYLDFTPANVHGFLVTVPFAQQLGDQAPRWGFVLRGARPLAASAQALSGGPGGQARQVHAGEGAERWRLTPRPWRDAGPGMARY
jgi:hypothetical protein